MMMRIVNAMYGNAEEANRVAELLDVSPDPDAAAEQLSMIPDDKLKDVVEKLDI